MQIERREFEDRIKYGYWEGEKFKNHREDGPAIEWKYGGKTWYFYGKIHREDGPAIEWSNVMKYWYLENEKIEEEDFEEAVKIYLLPQQVEQDMQVERREFKNRVEYGYYQGDEFIWHREDGPAIDYTNGNKAWFIHGKYHREDGPAVECVNGTNYWFFHRKYHREDGPAVEYANGYKEWWIEDERIKEEDFEEAVKTYKVSKLCK